jgi:hypothetical protein
MAAPTSCLTNGQVERPGRLCFALRLKICRQLVKGKTKSWPLLALENDELRSASELRAACALQGNAGKSEKLSAFSAG